MLTCFHQKLLKIENFSHIITSPKYCYIWSVADLIHLLEGSSLRHNMLIRVQMSNAVVHFGGSRYSEYRELVKALSIAYTNTSSSYIFCFLPFFWHSPECTRVGNTLRMIGHISISLLISKSFVLKIRRHTSAGLMDRHKQKSIRKLL